MKKHEAHNLICEALIEALNSESYPGGQGIPPAQTTPERTPEQIEFARGLKAGLKARTHGGKFIMDDEQLKNHYPKAFIKGYKQASGDSWWDRFNDKLTSLAGRLGYSRTRGF